ncbi:MAG: gamma-glutamyltransferase [Rhizomicrobium sp.]
MLRSSILAGLTGMLLLGGCSFNVGGSLLGSTDRLSQVVGDEPYAVKTGAAILAQGGNAVDAATAMYFTLSATYPAAAGLGGGGVCIVRDPAKEASEEFVFLPANIDGSGYALPGTVAAMAAMHTAYGKLPWQKVIAPGESYARTGFPMTKALAARLASVGKAKLDPAVAAEFYDAAGNIKPVGATLTNPELASTLAAVRTEGLQVFYRGKIAQAIVAALKAQGVTVTAEELGNYKLVRATPRVTEVGGNYVYLPSSKAASGYANALIDAVAHHHKLDVKGLSAAVQQTLSQSGLTASGDVGATGFAVTDLNGVAVSCAVTLNAPFGTGHGVPGTGIVLAAASGPNNAYLSPVIASESSDGPAVLAGAGAGGPNGAAVLADALLRLGRDEPPVKRSDLAVLQDSPYDAANLIVCNSDVCTAMPDPAGSGMGVSVPLPVAKK